MPFRNTFWEKKKRIMQGRIIINAAAMYRFHCVSFCKGIIKLVRYIVKVNLSGVERIIKGPRKSFQKKTNANTPTDARAGVDNGRIIFQ